MNTIVKNYRKLFPGVTFELFGYFLNFQLYDTQHFDISDFEELKLALYALLCVYRLDASRILEIVSDLSVKYESNSSVLKLLYVVCFSRRDFSRAEEAPANMAVYIRERRPMCTVAKALQFNVGCIQDLRLTGHFYATPQALQPLPDSLLSRAQDAQISLLEEYSQAKSGTLQDDLAFMEIMAIATCGRKFVGISTEKSVLRALEEIQSCVFGSGKFNFLKHYTEHCLVQFVQTSMEDLFYRLYTTREVIDNRTIFCIEYASFGKQKYDRFSIFEQELFKTGLGNDLLRNFNMKMHYISWVIRLCNLQNSQQLRLCSIELVYAFKRIFAGEYVDLAKIELKVKSSFDIFYEFNLRYFFAQSPKVPVFELEGTFLRRYKELQRYYVYKQMLDCCCLVYKQERYKLAGYLEKNTYHRLDHFAVVVSAELQKQIEIGLGYSADRQVVLDLIQEMKEEFCNDLNFSDETFNRILARSAPKLWTFWAEIQHNAHYTEAHETAKHMAYASEVNGVSNTDEAQSSLNSHRLSELRPQEEFGVAELLPPAYDALIIEPAEESKPSLKETIFQSARPATNCSLQNLSKLTFDYAPVEYTDEDFYFNADFCISCMLSPIDSLDRLLQMALAQYYEKQKLCEYMLTIVQFYTCQSSLLLSDYMYTGRCPTYIFEGPALLQPQLSALYRLPLSFQAFYSELEGKRFFFAKCDPINAFLLNPVYSGLNIIFHRLLGHCELLARYNEMSTQLKREKTRRARILYLLCFRGAQAISQRVMSQLYQIRYKLDVWAYQRSDSFLERMTAFYSMLGGCFEATAPLLTCAREYRAYDSIGACVRAQDEREEAFLITYIKKDILEGRAG